VLARKYFSEAVLLAPDDERFKGFLAGMELGEAAVDGDEKLKRRGYFDLMKAKDAWPEFKRVRSFGEMGGHDTYPRLFST
jgi:hypothetical protein